MFKRTLFVNILIAVLAFVKGEDVVELTDVQTSVADTNPATVAILTQLRVKQSNSPDAINTYKCTVGNQPTSRMACTAGDGTSWPTPHDVELTLRCPKSGSGLILSYVEIFYSVSSSSVSCRVHEGGVGLGYIVMTINAWNTIIFDYSAKFFA